MREINFYAERRLYTENTHLSCFVAFVECANVEMSTCSQCVELKVQMENGNIIFSSC